MYAILPVLTTKAQDLASEVQLLFVYFQRSCKNMKTEDKANMPRVRIAVLGKINVGKSGKYLHISLAVAMEVG